MSLKSIDFKWLVVGVIIGYLIHMVCTHPKSPISGSIPYIGGNQ